MTRLPVWQPAARFLASALLLLAVWAVIKRCLLPGFLPGITYPVTLLIISGVSLPVFSRRMIAVAAANLAVVMLMSGVMYWNPRMASHSNWLLAIQVVCFVLWSGVYLSGKSQRQLTQMLVWLAGLGLQLWLLPGVSFSQELFWLGHLMILSALPFFKQSEPGGSH